MNVSLLAVSIGNTRTHLGTFVEGKLVATQDVASAPGQELAAALERGYEALRHRGAPLVVASVNPEVTGHLMQQARQCLPGTAVRRVESDLAIPIGRQLDPETIVGEDRLLNAAAAYEVLKQACVVIDAGTAITVDFVDGAGTFHGGAIGPGAQMMLNSLHQHTALLPEVEFEVPADPIGHNTHQAMLSAVFYGLRGMIRELVEQYARVAGAFPMVVATGGNADVLFKGFELVERIVPDLALLGIAATLQADENDGDDDATGGQPE